MDEQYAELTELAGGFIHEIKNHLSTLGLNLQLLAEDFQEPESQRERRALTRVQRLQAECQRLVNVANDFLRFARIKDLERVPTALGRVIEEMIDFFGPTARTANIEIKSYLPADLPPVALDRDLFKQALLNLMLNAEQAMPGGGELTVQAQRIAECNGQSAECAEAVELSLIDTGVGMTPEVRAKVFQPFFSTKQDGTGLGLPTTRRIVEAHGGTLDVESEVGRGTKFTVRLPACGPDLRKEKGGDGQIAAAVGAGAGEP
jgi:signal transduction histidine kinase